MVQKTSDIFHWGFTVPDIHKAVDQWTREGAEVIIPPTEAKGLGVYNCVVMYRGAAPIELVGPAREGAMDEQIANGGGLDHVCFFADDVSVDAAELI